jgi:hypothetical protein
MKTRSKLAALLGAGILVVGAYGMAFAATGPSDRGVTPVEHSGNITADGNGGSDKADCDKADAVEGGKTSGQETSGNGVTVTWTYDSTTKAFSFTSDGLVLIAYIKGGDNYNEYNYGAGVSSDGNMFAPDNASEGPAGLSHSVFCTAAGEESAPPSEAPSEVPSFEASQEGATDVPTEPNTATVGAGTSTPSDGSWLFVAALGVILASVVVMTPARAKNRR